MTWFDVLISQMSVFILFVSAGVVFDGAFSLWVSLNKLAKSSVYNYYKSAIMVTVFKKSILEKFSLKQVSKEVLSTYMFE